MKTFTLCDLSLSIKLKLSLLRAVFFLGRGLTIVGSILEGDFKERTEDVALAKEVRGRFRANIMIKYRWQTERRIQ